MFVFVLCMLPLVLTVVRAERVQECSQKAVSKLVTPTSKVEQTFDRYLLKHWYMPYQKFKRDVWGRIESGVQKYHLTEFEALGIYLYGLEASQEFNAALRGYYGDDLDQNERVPRKAPSREEYLPIIDVIQAGLKKLPAYQGIVYRFAKIPKAVFETYKPNAIVSDAAFTSATRLDYDPHNLGLPQRFKILSKSGKQIDQLVASPYEEEVLFAPGTKFRVLDLKKSADGSTQIDLEEMN